MLREIFPELKPAKIGRSYYNSAAQCQTSSTVLFLFFFGQCSRYVNDCFSEQDIPFTSEILLDGWVMKSNPISFTIHLSLIY